MVGDGVCVGGNVDRPGIQQSFQTGFGVVGRNRDFARHVEFDFGFLPAGACAKPVFSRTDASGFAFGTDRQLIHRRGDRRIGTERRRLDLLLEILAKGDERNADVRMDLVEGHAERNQRGNFDSLFFRGSEGGPTGLVVKHLRISVG